MNSPGDRELITEIFTNTGIQIDKGISMDELHFRLANHVNYLVQHDFQKLLTLLYRVDVNEDQLKKLMRQRPGEDAGRLIASLLIERQLQKIITRKKHHDFPQEDNSEERW